MPLGRRSIRQTVILVAALLTLLFVVDTRSGPAALEHASTNAAAAQRAFVFPLRVSRNRRYLVDQRGKPFLIVGDSPQALIGDLSLKDAETYLADREKAGFNAIWVNLLCVTYTGCRRDGATYDGIKPFRSAGDLSKPNPAYFKRAEAMIRLAGRHHIVVFLDPIETGGWIDVLQKNGVAKDRAYGRFLGKRYKRFGNIVWWNGNDFQTWRDSSDDAAVLAVARGIRSTDPRHLQTLELNYFDSGSLDDTRWRSIIGLDGAYTYHATYARVLTEYRRKKFMPVYMQEAGYDGEQNAYWISPGTPQVLRRQEYWSALSGAAGQLYGNHYTWQFLSKWQDHLDTPGSEQFGYLSRLLQQFPWFRLVPDFKHRVVTSGFGTYDGKSNVASNNYVAASATPSGRLALAYLPAGGTVSVNFGRFAGKVRVRWFDPTNGRFRLEPGGTRPNSGIVRLTPPGTNSLGDPDWLLVLTA
jgi:Protein of unknown function (DUF4038)/Putative collagen-binding domain of a collagenase